MDTKIPWEKPALLPLGLPQISHRFTCLSTSKIFPSRPWNFRNSNLNSATTLSFIILIHKTCNNLVLRNPLIRISDVNKTRLPEGFKAHMSFKLILGTVLWLPALNQVNSWQCDRLLFFIFNLFRATSFAAIRPDWAGSWRCVCTKLSSGCTALVNITSSDDVVLAQNCLPVVLL
jgi:hypothetical protein